jgi:beta-ureidopropionase
MAKLENSGNNGGRKPAMAPVAPYMAIGVSTVVHGIGSRKDIGRNLDTIEDGIHAAMSVVSINLPVKLIALAEGALTGFTDEAFDLPHTIAAKELFIDIPGEETDRLARLAINYGTYIIVQCKARWPEVMKNRFFNTLIVIDPRGKIVHKAAKNHIWCRERSCTPHDVITVLVKRVHAVYKTHVIDIQSHPARRLPPPLCELCFGSWNEISI